MSKPKKPKQKNSSRWTPFVAVIPHRDGVRVELEKDETYWSNSFYTVVKKLIEGKEDGAIHLSIRHNQRKAVRDWRHFQRIKNELAGPEREGIEVFPPESQLVDTANQYHLFVYPVGMSSPFSWDVGRHVTDDPNDAETRAWVESIGANPDEVAGAVQRPYEKEGE